MKRETMVEQLSRLAEGLAQTFGSSCETVIHDMDNREKSILSINNGHVTGRSVGDPFNILGKPKEISEFMKNKTDLINCLGKTEDGRVIKSSTFQFIGDDFHFSLGINYDLTLLTLAEKAIRDISTVSVDLEEKLNESESSSLDQIFQDCLERMGKPLLMFNREDRKRMIGYLHEKKAFSIQKSIPRVSEKLGISRHTVYNYLREMDNPEE